MQGDTIHGALRYRCRYPAEYALAEGHDHPKQVYVAERPIVEELDRWISSTFNPARLSATCEQLAAVSAAPNHLDETRVELARRQLADCDARLARYRAALDSGADPAVVSGWITQTQGEKLGAQQLLVKTKRETTTAEDIRALLEELGDVCAALKDADADAKADLYGALGLNLTYKPNEQVVDVVAEPTVVDISACRRAVLGAGRLAHPAMVGDWP